MRRHAFTVPGIPRGKGRPRFYRRGAHVATYTDDRTAAFENLVRLACQMDGPPFEGPVCLTVHAEFPYPKSWSRKRIEAEVFHVKRPDADNILKAVLDGLNGVAWVDDSCVAQVTCTKRYTVGEPGLHVVIETMESKR